MWKSPVSAGANDLQQTCCSSMQWICLTILTVSFISPCSAYDSCQATVRPCDSVWLISTRHIHGHLANPTAALQYFRYCPHTGWVHSSQHEFDGSQCPGAITSIYVHGNRIRPDVARRRGISLYQDLAEASMACVPVRQIIWSWPSRRLIGPIRDVRSKAQRTGLESYLLGSWVAQFAPEERMSMVGFSFGARIITGALHLLAGGSYAGYLLHSPIETRPKTRVVAIAAAIDSDWLHPQGCHGMACQGIDKLLLFYNPRDVVLRHFDLLRPGKAALGAAGPAGGLDPCLNGRFEMLDASPIIGSRHSWNAYVTSPTLMGRLVEHALWRSDTAER